MNLLAFDLGASGGKIFLSECSGKKASFQEIYRFKNSPCVLNDGLYWDFISIFRHMNDGIREAIRLTGDNIDSFGIDTFSNDFGIIDRNGELLCPVRCYRDKRTERFQHKVYEKMPKRQLYFSSGNQNALFNTLMQLVAMKEAGQDFYYCGGSKLLLLPDLIIYFLTGRIQSEYTVSSVSGMYDFKSDGWNNEILNAFGIPKSMLGKIVKPGTVVGKTSPAYNDMMKTKGFTVAAVCEHDTASAYIASTCPADCARISSGTWTLIGTEVPSPIINEESFNCNFANEGGYGKKYRFLKDVIGNFLLQETKKYYDALGEKYSYDDLDRMALQAPAFKYFIDVDDESFFGPGNIPEKITASCMRRYKDAPKSVGEIVRCIYDSLAMQYRWVIEKLERISGKKLRSINIFGGGAKSDVMCGFTADACGKTVIAGPYDATAIGNIAVQLVAAGTVNSIEDAKVLLSDTYETKIFKPTQTALWQKEYERFIFETKKTYKTID